MDDLEARLRRVTEAEDREAVWEHLTPLWAQALREPRVATLWAEALRTTPGRPELEAEASEILEAFPGDPTIVGAVCDALIRRAARRPFDEPPTGPGPGAQAAEAAGRCLGRLSAARRADPDVGGALLALEGNALRVMGPSRLDDAARSLERAIDLEPRVPWLFDLGLVHKRAGAWPEALDANRRARERSTEAHRGVLFNLAVAATALGRGDEAAQAWRAAGVEATCEPRALPFVEGLPPAQVRLPTRGSGHAGGGDVELPDEAASFEAVWVQPLSPCHGVVRSPTHRAAIADFGDVILWDPAPVAVLEIDGEPVPRFPLLGVLREGDERRLRFLALQQRAGQVDAIAEALPEGVILYPHGERVEIVCPRCAAGERLVEHDHQPAEEHRIVFGKLVVPADRDLVAFAETLERARKTQPGVMMAVPDLYEALGETAKAGQHHKRWGVIERTGASGAR